MPHGVKPTRRPNGLDAANRGTGRPCISVAASSYSSSSSWRSSISRRGSERPPGYARHDLQVEMPPSDYRFYGDLAAWWPLISAVEDYAEEAGLFASVLRDHVDPLRTVLELGSGGGNNAWHMKAGFAMTLVDLSPAMLATSRAINPECEHLEGDIREVRLGRTFRRGVRARCHRLHDDRVGPPASDGDRLRRTAARVVWLCSSPTTPPRRSSPTPITADTMGLTDGRCVTSSGPPTRIRATRGSSPSTPSCSAKLDGVRRGRA